MGARCGRLITGTALTGADGHIIRYQDVTSWKYCPHTAWPNDMLDDAGTRVISDMGGGSRQ